jgi:hypothetical protein
LEHQPKNVGILHQSGHSAKHFGTSWWILLSGYYSSLFWYFQASTKDNLYGKALHAYHSIFKSFSNVENVPIKLMLKLFSSAIDIVTPILL